MPRQMMAFAVLAMLTCAVQLHGQCVPRPGAQVIESFSSLATVGGLQNPSGMELILKENGNHVDALLRDYMGDASAQETKLTGTIEEQETDSVTTCEVTLTGTSKQGAIRIRGVIKPTCFSGTIKRRVGHDDYSHKFSLKRRLPEDTSEKNV